MKTWLALEIRDGIFKQCRYDPRKISAFVFILDSIQEMPRLLVATEEGYLYVYSVEPTDGGQCNLLRQHRYDGSHRF